MSEINPSRRDNEEEEEGSQLNPVNPPISGNRWMRQNAGKKEIGVERREKIKKLLSPLKMPFVKFWGTEDGFTIIMGSMMIFLLGFFMFVISALTSQWYNLTYYGYAKGSWLHIAPMTIILTVIALLLFRFFFPEWFKET